MSKIVSKDGTEKQVKNLGWLLRNWKEVERFELSRRPQLSGYLIAHLKDGRRYETDFQSFSVMLNFLHRPVFFGVIATIDGAQPVEIGGMQYEIQRQNPHVKLI